MTNKYMQKFQVTVDIRIFILGLLALLGIFAFVFLKSIIAMFFIAFVLNTGLRPIVNRLEDRGVPRTLSIAGIYIFLLVGLIALTILMANQFISQVENLITAIPQIAANLISFTENYLPAVARVLPLDVLQREADLFAVDTQKSSIFKEFLNRENVLVIVSQAYGLFGSAADLLIRIIAVIMVSGYMLQKKNNFYEGLIEYIPTRRKKSLRNILDRIETNLGSWLLGQLGLMVVVGVMTYLALSIPGLIFPGEAYKLDDYALPIAILAGFLEGIPSIGPLFTLIFTLLLALGTSSVFTVLYVLVIFLALQQVQSNIMSPQVMKRAVGIDPIISILAIIAAFQLYGVLGAVFVIPVLAIIKIIVGEFIKVYYPTLLKES